MSNRKHLKKNKINLNTIFKFVFFLSILWIVLYLAGTHIQVLSLITALISMFPGIWLGIKIKKKTNLLFASILFAVLFILGLKLLISASNIQDTQKLSLLITTLFFLSSISGLMWGTIGKEIYFIFKRNCNKNSSLEKEVIPRWMHKFIRDEEKTAILIDYRIKWYGNRKLTKWIRFKVWIKTLHYIFYEVYFKEKLDKIMSFAVKIPRR